MNVLTLSKDQRTGNYKLRAYPKDPKPGKRDPGFNCIS